MPCSAKIRSTPVSWILTSKLGGLNWLLSVVFWEVSWIPLLYEEPRSMCYCYVYISLLTSLVRMPGLLAGTSVTTDVRDMPAVGIYPPP